jgi:hypothetical protein
VSVTRHKPSLFSRYRSWADSAVCDFVGTGRLFLIAHLIVGIAVSAVIRWTAGPSTLAAIPMLVGFIIGLVALVHARIARRWDLRR